MKKRAAKEKDKWPRRGSWLSFLSNLLIACVFTSFIFVDHPAIQRFLYVNVLVVAAAVFMAARDIFLILKGNEDG